MWKFVVVISCFVIVMVAVGYNQQRVCIDTVMVYNRWSDCGGLDGTGIQLVELQEEPLLMYNKMEYNCKLHGRVIDGNY